MDDSDTMAIVGHVFNVVAFAGSLRRASYNRALLRASTELAPSALHIMVFELDDIPLYSEDIEAAGTPPSVVRLRDAIRKADGLLIATPEYNYGVPGVLKNAIDWLSRPPRDSALDGKVAAIIEPRAAWPEPRAANCNCGRHSFSPTRTHCSSQRFSSGKRTRSLTPTVD